MKSFLFKKMLYDTWDNLFRLVLLNLGFLVSAAIPALLPRNLVFSPGIAVAVLVLGVLWCFVYLTAAALVLKEIPDSGKFGFLEFFQALKAGWLTGLIFGASVLVLGLVLYTSVRFYAGLDSLAGTIAVALMFWLVLALVLALQFFLPLRARFEANPWKAFKKCFLILLDNLPFSLFCALCVLVMLVFSLFTAFLLLGPAHVLSFLDQALRLRMLKYDYLEKNPAADRRKIPWHELLAEERAQTGNRSFKSFIYPWKD